APPTRPQWRRCARSCRRAACCLERTIRFCRRNQPSISLGASASLPMKCARSNARMPKPCATSSTDADLPCLTIGAEALILMITIVIKNACDVIALSSRVASPAPSRPENSMSERSDPVVIAASVRTPLGRFQGELSPIAAPRLGSTVIRTAVERAGLAPERIDEVLMGCVLPAGQGQAPARQAARGAGLPDATGATTINKVCGSGRKAVMLGHDLITAGSADIIVAGGMESMSNAPYLLSQARAGYRFGHGEIFDHAALDGLEDAYEKGRSMGTFGEDTAQAYQFTRDAQDAYAIETLKRARHAIETGSFEAEIVPVAIPAKNGSAEISRDENPLKARPERIPTLKPAFRADGTVTAASSSANADGAAAIVLTKRSTADRLGLPVLAKIVAQAGHAQEPRWFTTAPIPAIR